MKKIMIIFLFFLFSYLLLVLILLPYMETIESDQRRKSININIAQDIAQCQNPDYPFPISVQNLGNKILKSMRIEVEAFQPGRSNNLVRNLGPYEWDLIVRPKEKKVGCFKWPFILTGFENEKLIYKASFDVRDLIFYSNGEYIPN